MSDRYGFRLPLKGPAGFVANVVILYMEMDNKPEFEWIRFDELEEDRMCMSCGVGENTVVATVEIQFEEKECEGNT